MIDLSRLSSACPAASLGLLLGSLVAVTSMSLMACWGPDPEPQPPCAVTPGLASETRVLEMGELVREYDRETDTTTYVWSPFVGYQEVPQTRGGQGSNMLSFYARFPASPEEGTEDRCMLVTYQRRGMVGEDGEENENEFTVRQRLRNVNGYWRLLVQDVAPRNGPVDVLVSVEDNIVMGSVEMSLVVINSI